MSGPPDKWNVYVNISKLNSGQVLELLNDQAALGNTTALFVTCTDGPYLFFGNYSNNTKKPQPQGD